MMGTSTWIDALLLAEPADYPARLAASLAVDGHAAEGLAAALKTCYDDAYAGDPPRAAAAVALLGVLATLAEEAAVQGYACWAAGLAAMDEGRLGEAVAQLAAAETHFTAAGQAEKVAAVQVGQLPVYAMQGRFDEAAAAGLAARAYAEAHGDWLTAGKLEQNLGNLDFLRHRYREAEAFYRRARLHFEQVDDARQLAQVDNCLATTLTSQHRFAEAEVYFEQAIRRAEAGDLALTLAEIECNVGCLALYQGRYDRALDYLERSRRRYAALEMPHERAVADQELADAYLELNLAAEAADIYSRVAPVFAELGMPVERARALAYHGRACILLGQLEAAGHLLEDARRLYAEVELPVGEAITQLTTAELLLQQDDLAGAAVQLTKAVPVFAAAHAEGWRLQARLLAGVVARRQGRLAEAQTLLEETLHAAEAVMTVQVVQRCAGELGLVAAATGDTAVTERYFRQAVDLIETMRAPLPAEEFRMGFVGDKLTPYMELVRLCLADGTPARQAEALALVERSRARALVDLLGAEEAVRAPRDDFEADMAARLEGLRNELNWFYSQLNRPDGSASRGVAAVEQLQAEVRSREEAFQTILRQLQQRSDGRAWASEALDLPALQAALGNDTVLVEYFAVAEGLYAFVVTGAELITVELGCTEAAVLAAQEQLHFQLGALRHAGTALRRQMPRLLQRVQRPLATLYDLLVAPVPVPAGVHRLVFAPYGPLHYLPFHALYDGAAYLVETHEVSVTPSATLLYRCLAAPAQKPRRALLLGLPDDFAPHVADEIAAIAPLFAEAVTLLGDAATRRGLQLHAPAADLLHIACHGRFRSDNPFFSSLHLADGWLVVRDVYALELSCSLVTLSACETGISALAPGDDLVGLARGFLRAGAPALVVSQWMVDDAATAELMAAFYRALVEGQRPAAALAQAQRRLLATHPHPFFWAPFTLIGRW